jgi:hypothetical protein
LSELEKSCTKILKYNKPHGIKRIILAGDTNYFSMFYNWITRVENTFEISLKVKSKRYNLKCIQNHKTCCDNKGLGVNLNKYADFIFDSLFEVKNNIVEIHGDTMKFEDLLVISDHLPISASIRELSGSRSRKYSRG